MNGNSAAEFAGEAGGGSLRRRARGLVVVGIGLLAIAAAFYAGPISLLVAGWLLVICGVLEMWETFSAPYGAGWLATYFGGLLSVGAGMLLLSRPEVQVGGLAVLVAAAFLTDGVGKLMAAFRSRATGEPWKRPLALGLFNVAMGAALVAHWPLSGRSAVVTLAGLRIVAAGWSILIGRRATASPAAVALAEHPDSRLGLPAHAEFAQLGQDLIDEEEKRRAADTYWSWVIVLVFFAIHIGRMRVEWTAVGLVSPIVAVAGDVAVALLTAFALVLPTRMLWRWLTRGLERRAWESRLARIDSGHAPGVFARFTGPWLFRRARFTRRISQASRSPRAALRWGLQVGLPIAAVLVAVNPIWGFSWFFNSESWATEVWNRWAEERTDTWRNQMIAAVRDAHGPRPDLFAVRPDGIDQGDFSFLVVGDPGEGDASQLCLKDRILSLGNRPDVKFLVVSSDVIYPTGAMLDYEQKFYLPFKGFTKPIYAIPGNHDWYDALEGFAANFLDAESARQTIRARVEADARLTTTTDSRIDAMIGEAQRLRDEFGVSTGRQRGPFFEVHSPRFSLIAVDTGVLKTLDAGQWQWFNAALDRARGKFTFVILGHPLYAGGRYQAQEEEAAGPVVLPPLPLHREEVHDFAEVHRRLREHGAEVVMAGDTHYFEHYREKYDRGGENHVLHHFVNGGGGAYISIGTPFDWPDRPDAADSCYYPSRDVLTRKLDRETPRWKWPLWFWTKRLGGWPFSAEALAGAFDFNSAPYVQSFMEVRVENSAGLVRLIVHGANGPVKWRDVQVFGTVIPDGKSGDDAVEIVIPMAAAR